MLKSGMHDIDIFNEWHDSYKMFVDGVGASPAGIKANTINHIENEIWDRCDNSFVSAHIVRECADRLLL